MDVTPHAPMIALLQRRNLSQQIDGVACLKKGSPLPPAFSGGLAELSASPDAEMEDTHGHQNEDDFRRRKYHGATPLTDSSLHENLI